jgi:hypothetical protein
MSEHPPHRTWNVDEPAARFGEGEELEMTLEHEEPGSIAGRRTVTFWITWAVILGLIVVGIVLAIVLP